ncbi:hypothetical protein SELMODRAFT_416887 [Selaginella moellendorffii]|uniref:Uncharacterized protein n=1 Tax=Selaginella moellendorffii TaxID=88036 RepID=D8S0Q2_SELML|nr:hypothetical protein SELMODRAFT_416887 [Selaginella moellendorffii]
MNIQIDVGVIEAIGTSAPEAAATVVIEAAANGAGVFASDVGGGGGVVPSVAEVACGKVDEPVEEVIGSIVGGSTAKAIGGMVTAPTTPQASSAEGASGGEGLCMHDFDTILNDRVRDTIIQAQERTISKVLQEMAWNGPHRFLVPLCRLVQSHWVHSAYDLNMAIYSSFAELNEFAFQAHTLVHDIEHLWFIGMLSLEELAARKGQELQTSYNLLLDFLVAVWAKTYDAGTGKAPEELIYNISKSITLEEYIRACLVELGNGWLSHGGTSSTEFKNQPRQPFLVRRMVYRYFKYCPGAPVYTTGVLQKLLTRSKKLGMYEPKFYCPCTHERELCPWYLELVEQMPTSNFELDLYLECHPGNSSTLLLTTPEGAVMKPFMRMLQRATISLFGRLRHSSHPSLWVCPLSPMASVGEVVVLIGDYTQLLDATSRELYMLDRGILRQLTPYGKINFIFFNLPDGMPPPQEDTSSWNVLQAQHISQSLKVASSFITYEGVVVMILPCSLMWEGTLGRQQ